MLVAGVVIELPGAVAVEVERLRVAEALLCARDHWPVIGPRTRVERIRVKELTQPYILVISPNVTRVTLTPEHIVSEWLGTDLYMTYLERLDTLFVSET